MRLTIMPRGDGFSGDARESVQNSRRIIRRGIRRHNRLETVVISILVSSMIVLIKLTWKHHIKELNSSSLAPPAAPPLGAFGGGERKI